MNFCHEFCFTWVSNFVRISFCSSILFAMLKTRYVSNSCQQLFRDNFKKKTHNSWANLGSCAALVIMPSSIIAPLLAISLRDPAGMNNYIMKGGENSRLTALRVKAVSCDAASWEARPP